MGNLEIELDTNTAPIVSVTQRELRDIQLLSLRLFPENVTQVIEIMKNDEDFAQFLLRNFCDRSVGFFDRSKLISWIENSFYHKKTYLGEQATFFSFDADELNDELEVDLEIGDFRLMEVDNKIVLPIGTHVRVIISSGDVIHC